MATATPLSRLASTGSTLAHDDIAITPVRRAAHAPRLPADVVALLVTIPATAAVMLGVILWQVMPAIAA